MATIKQDVEELVRRVERVGWEITRRGGGGWRVKAPGGEVIPIHNSISNARSVISTRQLLEKAGLTAAEAKLAKAHNTRKAAAARKTAAANAAVLHASIPRQREPSAAQRAAGPYYTGPEDVELSWFTTKHPAPWMRWVNFTVPIARYIMEHHNNTNRPLNETRKNHYLRIMRRGEWHLTHQGMAMDTDAEFQDGQHRAQALIDLATETGDESHSFPVPFFVGMPAANFMAIDEGGNRSPADLFARGGVAYGGQISTIVRLSIAFNDQSPKRMFRERQTNERILGYYAGDSEELGNAARWAVANSRKARISAGPLGAAYYLLRKANGPGNRYVKAFFSGLVNGTKTGSRTKLDDLDPRESVRRFFQNARENQRRVSGLEAVSMIVLAWNLVVEQRFPRYIRFTDESDIPRIVLAKDPGDATAVALAPRALEGEIEE